MSRMCGLRCLYRHAEVKEKMGKKYLVKEKDGVDGGRTNKPTLLIKGRSRPLIWKMGLMSMMNVNEENSFSILP